MTFTLSTDYSLSLLSYCLSNLSEALEMKASASSVGDPGLNYWLSNNSDKSKVSDQNGVSLLYIIVEIYTPFWSETLEIRS